MSNYLFGFFSDAGMMKLYGNDDIRLPELYNLNQIQCLPELNNNNTTNSNQVVQSHLFNNSSEYDSNSLKGIFEEKQNDINVVNQIETTPLNNHSQKKIGLLAMELNASNEINMENYVQTNHPSVSIDDEDDLKTTQALMSLAMKITNQQELNFKYADGFEDENTNNLNILNTSNEIQISSHLTEQNSDQIVIPLLQQNGHQITYPHILEDEYQITNSLKILESLVNIEHSKLEEPTNVTEEESPPSNINSKKKKFKKKSNSLYRCFRRRKNNKSKKRKLRDVEDVEDDDEEWNQKDEKYKKNESKKMKEKSRKTNQDQRSICQNNLDNLLNSNSSNSSVGIQNEQDFRLGINGLSLSNSHKKTTSTSVSTSLNTVSSLEVPLKSQSVNDNLLVDKEGKTTTNSSGSNALKSNFIASDTNYETNKSALLMKTSDHKKLYEIDCKSSVSSDTIITAKLTNNFINKTKGDGFIKVQSSNSLIETHETKFQFDDSISTKKKILKHSKNTNTKQLNTKTNSNLTINELKRLRIGDLDNEININKKNKKSRITDVENQKSNNVDTLKELNEMENAVFKNEEFLTNTVNNLSLLPEWLKRKCMESNIKPSFVTIGQNMFEKANYSTH